MCYLGVLMKHRLRYDDSLDVVYAWILARLWQKGMPGGYWLAPVVHAGLELIYPFLFQSFLANSQIHFLAFMQIAEVVGVIGGT